MHLAAVGSFSPPSRHGGEDMTDRYIDASETQFYGPHASKVIKSHVVGLVPALDGALKYVATELDHATAAVGKLSAASREADKAVRTGVKGKKPVREAATDVLVRFAKHLDA